MIKSNQKAVMKNRLKTESPTSWQKGMNDTKNKDFIRHTHKLLHRKVVRKPNH